jgi:hypothetical protein
MYLPHSSARLCSLLAVSAAPRPHVAQLEQPLFQQPLPSVAGSPALAVPSGCRAEQGKREIAENQQIRTTFAKTYIVPGHTFAIHFIPIRTL